MSANGKQIGGNHYKPKSGTVQHWDVCVAENVPYLEAVATKYLTRWRNKNGVQDLEKSLHYIEKRIECLNKHEGIIRSVRKKEGLFNRFIEDNEIPNLERSLIDTIMHWKRIDQLYEAHASIKNMINEEMNATRHYVEQDGVS